MALTIGIIAAGAAATSTTYSIVKGQQASAKADEAAKKQEDDAHKAEQDLAKQQANEQAQETNDQKQAANRRAFAARAGGRKSTILTSPIGVTDSATTANKTLLGS